MNGVLRAGGREGWRGSVPLLLGVLAFLPVTGAAQEEVIRNAPTCSACSVRMERLGSFGDADDEGWVDLTSRVVFLGEEVVVVNLTARHQMMVFGRDGRFLRRMGRPGAGPGEFGVINDIMTSADGRLHVMDRGLGRMTVYAPGLTVERVIPFSPRPIDIGFLPLDDGSYVVNATVGSADRIGFPLHRIGPDGELLLTYPTPSTAAGPGDEFALLTRLAMGEDGVSFWATSTSGYRVDRFHLDGALLESFLVAPPWERDEAWAGVGGPPPSPPGVMAVQERDGLLWIVSRRRTPDYQAATSRIRNMHGLVTQIDDYNRYFESVLDIVDPRTRRLVSRSVIPGYLLRFVSPGVVLFHEEVKLVPRLVLYGIEVQGLTR